MKIADGTPDDAPEVAVMVGELLAEIMQATGVEAFRFDPDETVARLREALAQARCLLIVARHDDGAPIGFVTCYECFALYAEGGFGTIAEFYVRPRYRSSGVGQALAAQVKALAVTRGWRRIEVTTPPLPPFERTLAFYQREGFAITGGRKLKLGL